MTWIDKLRIFGRAPIQPIHPAWNVGQYVTYVLERDNGSWAAFALRVLSQSEDGSWAIEGDFKAPGGESTVLFRSNPSALAETIDLVPVQQTAMRRACPMSDAPASLVDDPSNITSLAMNLFLGRRLKAVAKSLSKDSRIVHYPCGIDRVHQLVTPGPGYQKHYDLSPRVLLTGVAGLAMDGGKNPMRVTSFGVCDPSVAAPSSYEDFVDLSYPKRVDHEGFTLSYPATWFLRQMAGQDQEGLWATLHTAQVGGVSCSLTLSVTIYSGPHERVRDGRDAARARLSGPLTGLSPRAASPLRLPGDASVAMFTMVHATIDAVVFAAVCSTDEGDRFALIGATGCIAKANPRRDETLAAYDQAFREVLESFRFV